MPAVTQNLLISQVPAPLAPPTPVQRATVVAPSIPGTLYGSLNAFYTGEIDNVVLTLNQVENEIANLGIAAGNGQGVFSGLALTAVSGLLGSASVGAAVGYGGIYNGSAQGFVCDDNSNNYIWITPGGSLAVQTGTLASPSVGAVYIGYALTVSGAITVLDTGGVVYLAGGAPYRTSGDRCVPTDTPPDTLFLQSMIISLHAPSIWILQQPKWKRAALIVFCLGSD